MRCGEPTSRDGFASTWEAADVLRGRNIAVLSPHLDDAVLSIGGAISAAARGGAAVTVVTVLAGDPASTAAAGDWDRGCGFRTAGEAAHARRTEDLQACRLLGAEPFWLPFPDQQYGRPHDREVWVALEPVVREADTVLVPGFPLAHSDHRWLTDLVWSRRMPHQAVGLYVEQPYAIQHRHPPSPLTSCERYNLNQQWCILPIHPVDRRRKIKASLAYRSQMQYMAGRWPRSLLAWRIARYEARRGGEAVAWCTSPSFNS